MSKDMADVLRTCGSPFFPLDPDASVRNRPAYSIGYRWKVSYLSHSLDRWMLESFAPIVHRKGCKRYLRALRIARDCFIIKVACAPLKSPRSSTCIIATIYSSILHLRMTVPAGDVCRADDSHPSNYLHLQLWVSERRAHLHLRRDGKKTFPADLLAVDRCISRRPQSPFSGNAGLSQRWRWNKWQHSRFRISMKKPHSVRTPLERTVL